MTTSRYRVFIGSIGFVLVFCWLGAVQAWAQFVVGPLDYRDYDLYDMGISNPGALAYAPESNVFFVVYAGNYAGDAEHAKRSVGPRIFTVMPNEVFVDVFDLDLFGLDIGAFDMSQMPPINIAYDSRAARLLLYFPGLPEVIALQVEPNGSIGGTGNLTRYPVAGLGITDARGMVIDDLTGSLYILDNATHEVISTQPDAMGAYGTQDQAANGVVRIQLALPTTASLRGLAYDGKGHFYTLDANTHLLYKIDATGEIVMSYDLSAMGLTNPLGVVSAPSADSTDDPALIDLYLSDSGLTTVDCESCATSPSQDDGRLIELYLKSMPDLSVGKSASVPREKSASAPPTKAVAQAVQTEPVIAINGHMEQKYLSISTNANLGELYVLDWEEGTDATPYSENEHRFIIDGIIAQIYVAQVYDVNLDQAGDSSDWADLATVSAMGDALLTPKAAVELNPTREPMSLLGSHQLIEMLLDGTHLRVIDVTMVNSHTSTALAYVSPAIPEPAQASDLDLYFVGRNLVGSNETSASHGLTYKITVDAAALNNSRPVIDAGPDQTLLETFTVSLDATVSDDGEPNPPGEVSTYWRKISGPGLVEFADRRAMDTTATFSTYGVYVLRLFAADGGLGKSDEIVVTIEPKPLALRVDAGADQSVTLPNSIHLNGAVTPVAGSNATITATWSVANGPDSVTFANHAAISTTATVRQPGLYLLRLTAYDGKQIADDEVTIAVTVAVASPVITTSITVPIMDEWDDVEERTEGNVTNNNDLELAFDNGGNQTVGLRFLEVNVPPGATISNAYIQFTVDEPATDPAELTIVGEMATRAGKFSDAVDFNISSRARTTATVAWNPEPWELSGDTGPAQRTPNLAAAIQEIVHQAEWSSGNPLALIITGTGERVAQSYDLNPEGAPLLHIEYNLASPVEAGMAVQEDAD
jgi:hypothetical protein